jgi:hypothetical protein
LQNRAANLTMAKTAKESPHPQVPTMRRVLLILPLLAACGTPQERCINGVTRDLRVVDQLISTTQGNLERGYALEEVRTSRTIWVPCPVLPVAAGTAAPAPRLCPDTITDTDTRPKAINLQAEAETLKSLQAKRLSLARQSAPGIAQCKAQFPEP